MRFLRAYIFLISFLLLSSFAFAEDQASGTETYDGAIADLKLSLSQLDSSFENLTRMYGFLMPDALPAAGLSAHEEAMRRYLPVVALAQMDTATALGYVQQMGDAPFSPDLIPRFAPEYAQQYDQQLMNDFYDFMGKLLDANQKNNFATYYIVEAAFQVILDDTYFSFQVSLNKFRALEPELKALIFKISADNGNPAAAAKILMELASAASRLCQNSDVISYHKQFGELAGSLNDEYDLKTVYNAFIHAYSLSGDMETASRLEMELNAYLARLRSDEEVAYDEMMYEEKMYKSATAYDFDADVLEGYLDMPSGAGAGGVGIAESSIPEYFEYKLTVANLTELQFEYLAEELSYVGESLFVDEKEYAGNAGKFTLTTTTEDLQKIADAISGYDYKDFIIRSVSASGNNLQMTALGIPQEKFNPLLPVFEFIKMPETAINYDSFWKLLERAEMAQGVEGDEFRKILYVNLKFIMERASGKYSLVEETPALAASSAKFPLLLSMNYTTKGLASSDFGNFDAALAAFQNAATLWGQFPEADKRFPVATSRVSANLFAAAISAGKRDVARESAGRMEELMSSAGEDIEAANLQIAYANFNYLEGEYDKALERFEAAKNIAEKFTGVSDVLALINTGIGNCLIMKRDHVGAENAFAQASAFAEESGAELIGARSNSHLARVQLYRGKYADSEISASKALEAAEKFEDAELKWQARYTNGRAKEALGKSDEALQSYLSSLDVLKMTGYSSRAEGDDVSTDARDVYRYAIALAARMKKPETALTVMETHNSLSLREEFEKSDVNFKNAGKNGVVDEINNYKTEIKQLESGIQKQSAAAGAETGGGIEDMKKDLREKQREYIKYVSELGRNNGELSALYKIEPVDLVKIRENIPEDMAVLYYLLGEDKLYIFYVRRDGLGFREVEVDSNTLKNNVSMLRNECSDPVKAAGTRGLDPVKLEPADSQSKDIDRLKKISKKLYGLLIKPVENELSGITRIAIIPNGIFNFVPFQALMSDSGDEEFLINKYAFFQVDTLSIFQKPAPDSDFSNISLYGFGNADETLPSAEREVEAISKLFSKSEIFTGSQASESRAKELSENGGIYHFATHGFLNYKDISDSYILLAAAPGGDDDGKFTIEEVWGYWWGDSALVALSACNTALGELETRGKAVNPASAFLNAGAPSVLATLWSVDDDATSTLMKDFYENLKTMNKADALKNAQLALLKDPQTVHPFYWAPFNIIGDWR